jgi:hypothetical protein
LGKTCSDHRSPLAKWWLDLKKEKKMENDNNFEGKRSMSESNVPWRSLERSLIPKTTDVTTNLPGWTWCPGGKKRKKRKDHGIGK